MLTDNFLLPPYEDDLHTFCSLFKAYFVLDELILGGEIQETSKNAVLKAISQQDVVQEVVVCFLLYLLSSEIYRSQLNQMF